MFKRPLDFLSDSSSALEDETEEQKKARLEKEKIEQEKIEQRLKDQKDKSKDKDENVAALKRKKEALEKEVEDYKKKISEAEELKPLSKIAEYLKKKEGKVDEEAVNKFIDRNKKRKQDLDVLDKKVKEKDGALKEINLTLSDEWVEDIAKPLKIANESLTATLANFDKDEKIKHPELIQQLQAELLKTDAEGNPRSSVQIKALIQKFANSYNDKTGEEYEVPRINEVVDSVNTVIKRYNNAVEKKKNWDDYLKERQKEKEFEKAKQEEVLTKRELEGRQYLFRKALDSFDYSKIEGVLEKDDVEEVANSAHETFTLLSKGEKKPFSYDELITKMTKSELYDKLLNKFIEVSKELELEKKKSKSGLPRNSPDPSSRKKEEDDEVDKRIGKNPLDFLAH